MKALIFLFKRNCIQVRYKRKKEGERQKVAYTWPSWYHAYVTIFCEASVTVAKLLIVKGSLKWVKMEMWRQSGRCLVSK